MFFEKLELPPHAEAQGVTSFRDVIDAVGTDGFAQQLGRFLSVRLGVWEFSVLQRETPHSELEVIVSCGVDAERSLERAQGYADRFYSKDPEFQILNSTCPDGSYLLRVHADDIRHHGYKTTCFTRPGIREKATVAQQSRGKLIALSVFAGEGDPSFDGGKLEALREICETLLPLLNLHIRLLGGKAVARPVCATSMEKCVTQAFPQLTSREIAVCARSILGVTAEGIALDLGIKQTSVLTYRRRAYARLNINSINQLSTMLINSSAARQMAMAS